MANIGQEIIAVMASDNDKQEQLPRIITTKTTTTTRDQEDQEQIPQKISTKQPKKRNRIGMMRRIFHHRGQGRQNRKANTGEGGRSRIFLTSSSPKCTPPRRQQVQQTQEKSLQGSGELSSKTPLCTPPREEKSPPPSPPNKSPLRKQSGSLGSSKNAARWLQQVMAIRKKKDIQYLAPSTAPSPAEKEKARSRSAKSKSQTKRKRKTIAEMLALGKEPVIIKDDDDVSLVGMFKEMAETASLPDFSAYTGPGIGGGMVVGGVDSDRDLSPYNDDDHTAYSFTQSLPDLLALNDEPVSISEDDDISMVGMFKEMADSLPPMKEINVVPDNLRGMVESASLTQIPIPAVIIGGCAGSVDTVSISEDDDISMVGMFKEMADSLPPMKEINVVPDNLRGMVESASLTQIPIPAVIIGGCAGSVDQPEIEILSDSEIEDLGEDDILGDLDSPAELKRQKDNILGRTVIVISEEAKRRKKRNEDVGRMMESLNVRAGTIAASAVGDDSDINRHRQAGIGQRMVEGREIEL